MKMSSKIDPQSKHSNATQSIHEDLETEDLKPEKSPNLLGMISQMNMSQAKEGSMFKESSVDIEN